MTQTYGGWWKLQITHNPLPTVEMSVWHSFLHITSNIHLPHSLFKYRQASSGSMTGRHLTVGGFPACGFVTTGLAQTLLHHTWQRQSWGWFLWAVKVAEHLRDFYHFPSQLNASVTPSFFLFFFERSLNTSSLFLSSCLRPPLWLMSLMLSFLLFFSFNLNLTSVSVNKPNVNL